MIEESLKSVFVQFNFFVHNLAQMKFSSHQEGALLSFVPKTYRYIVIDKGSVTFFCITWHLSSANILPFNLFVRNLCSMLQI